MAARNRLYHSLSVGSRFRGNDKKKRNRLIPAGMRGTLAKPGKAARRWRV
jgi:hypothetical protein